MSSAARMTKHIATGPECSGMIHFGLLEIGFICHVDTYLTATTQNNSDSDWRSAKHAKNGYATTHFDDIKTLTEQRLLRRDRRLNKCISS